MFPEARVTQFASSQTVRATSHDADVTSANITNKSQIRKRSFLQIELHFFTKSKFFRLDSQRRQIVKLERAPVIV